mmetsp:Transcript_5931/g.19107  ORF Transcript_5931/g.19107 Transcript_5931/m.19107 type:complete len:207 (-) Transcript_5931:1713-2333(-)
MDDILAKTVQLVIALISDGDDRTLASTHFLNVALHLVVNAVLHRNEDNRHEVINQRNRAMLHFRSRIALGVNVRDLFHFERALESNRIVVPAAQEEAVVGEAVHLYTTGTRFHACGTGAQRRREEQDATRAHKEMHKTLAISTILDSFCLMRSSILFGSDDNASANSEYWASLMVRVWLMRSASMARTVTWQVKALVEATPISGPA